MTDIFSEVPAFKQSRLQSLFSDFSHLQDLNPEGFDANVDAWIHVLDLCLEKHYFGSSVTLPGAELSQKLTHPKYGPPKGLATVLDIQTHNGKYVPWSMYKFSSPEPPWHFKDYLSPMKWVESKLKAYRISSFQLLDRKGGVCNDYFISWDRMAVLGDRLGSEIIANVLSEGTFSAKLLDSDLFLTLVRNLDRNLSDVDIQVLLIYLSRDTGRLKVVNDHENAQRKFIKVDVSDITDTDIGVIKIKTNIDSLQDRIDILAERLDKEIPQKIKELLKKGKQDDRLKNVLVQKSYITRSLNKSLGIMSQLNMILDKINETEGNVSMFETMKNAKDVLASFNNKISFADIEKVQLELDAEIKVSNELTEAMAILPDMDEHAIDDELEMLEKEYKNSEAEKMEKVENNDDGTKVTGELIGETKEIEDKAAIDGGVSKHTEHQKLARTIRETDAKNAKTEVADISINAVDETAVKEVKGRSTVDNVGETKLIEDTDELVERLQQLKLPKQTPSKTPQLA